MTNFIVVDLTKVRNRKQREIAQIQQLLKLRRHNAQLTERYIGIFGKCRTTEHVEVMKKHLHDLCRSILDMEQELAAMQTPHIQQQLFNN